MRLHIFKYIITALVLSTVFSSFPPLGNDSADKKPVVSATDLKAAKGIDDKDAILNIPFDEDQNRVSVALPGGKHKVVEVELTSTTYVGTQVKEIDSKTITKPGAWFCFELQSKDKDVPYSWYFWLSNPAGRFKLFITADEDTYLTWIDFSTLCFAEVSKPMDKSQKMKKIDELLNHKRDKVQCVAVKEIIPQEPYVDLFCDGNTTAHYASIYVTSLEKDGKDGFKLQLHGADPSETYTFVTDKDAEQGWRVEE